MVEINTTEYLAQLLKDKKQIAAFPNVFIHLERLLDEEISRVRVSLFQLGTKENLCLPEPQGQIQQLCEKLYVPVKDYPEFNFVGRILGPRGMTAKQLEQETGCKIMVRGKGSMRDKLKEEQMKGKPNWEHLNDDLHVLITCDDTKNRAEIKLKRAIEEIKKLLVPAPEGEDELKKKQLMELAIINGTYRDNSTANTNKLLNTAATAAAAIQQATTKLNHHHHHHPIIITTQQTHPTSIRSSPSNPLGQPLIISSPQAALAANTAAATTTTLRHQLAIDPTTGAASLIYIPTATTATTATQSATAAAQQTANQLYAAASTTTDLNTLATINATQQLLQEYQNPAIDYSQAGAIKTQRISTAATLRSHPYPRVALS